jgi:cytochrome b6-f complex iron-sulfur subunit
MEARLLGLYRRLLAAYPPQFRDEYGDEMVRLLADMLRGRTPGGQLAVFRRAVVDLARTVARERVEAVQVAPAVATAGGSVPSAPPDARRRPPQLPSRRAFLRASLAVAGAGFGASIGGASLAFLWPSRGEGFGSLVDVGSVEEVAQAVRGSGGTWAVPNARAYVVAYDTTDDADSLYTGITAGGPFMALYQRCVHLGCRVPWCTSSTRFECPCHKSRYNRWGEWQDGPAPRGLDRFAVVVEDGRVIVDTRTVVTGPPRAGGALAEPPSGPSCLGV